MSIDRQRVRAVELLTRLGHWWDGAQWISPAPVSASPVTASLMSEADTMRGLLMDRAQHLAGCLEDSDEEAELDAIAHALEAYEEKRWPAGKIDGGKG